jgi:NAD(P)-dependent dehydrogenase (short-subunit alcohol dehydrogenase family)
VTGTDSPPRVALVTGAGRRIGKAIALDLARSGWCVGVHYASSKAEAEAVVARIEAEGGRAAALSADLADVAATADLVRNCTAALGAPSLLVGPPARRQSPRPDAAR